MMPLLRFLYIAISICLWVEIGASQLNSLPAGSLDRSFGQSGIALFGQSYAIGDSVASSDGTIYWVNSIEKNGFFAVQLTKVLSAGEPDPTFGANGHSAVSYDFHASGITLALQQDGKIIVAGAAQPTGEFAKFDFLVLRFLPNGQLDPDFGTNGVVIRDFPSPIPGELSSDFANFVTIKEDGTIIVGGSSSRWASPSRATAYLTLLALNGNGTLDSSFGTNGVSQTATGFKQSFTFPADRTVAGTNLSTGELLVGATVDLDRPDGAISRQCKLIRFEPNGSIDVDFGQQGILVITPGETSTCLDLAEISYGHILVSVGYGILKLSSSGSVDVSFGRNGIAHSWANRFMSDIFIANDGKILLAGTQMFSNSQFGVVQRFHPSGQLDVRFGNNGTRLIRIENEFLSIVRVHRFQDKYIYVTGACRYCDRKMMVVKLLTSK